MKSLSTICKHCAEPVDVPEAYLGRTIKCLKCSKDFEVKKRAKRPVKTPAGEKGGGSTKEPGCVQTVVILSLTGAFAWWLITSFAAGFREQSEKRAQTRQARAELREESNHQWFTGGTLHRKSLGDWSRASYENRLATSADFVAKMLEDSGKQPRSMNDLRPLAEELERNISAGNSERKLDAVKVAEFAAACWILMREGE